MRTRLFAYTSIYFALAGTLKAQQAASVRMSLSDSAAIRRFMDAQGPAEAVFSFGPTHRFRFKSGVYTIGDANFPLLNSPDSLVRFPVDKAYKRHRRARISSFATAVPLAVLTYSATRLVLTFGAVASGQRSFDF